MSSTTGNTYQRTAKQRLAGKRWNPHAPGRYARPKPEARGFTWWAEKAVQEDRGTWRLVSTHEAPRICALPAPYVSREME